MLALIVIIRITKDSRLATAHPRSLPPDTRCNPINLSSEQVTIFFVFILLFCTVGGILVGGRGHTLVGWMHYAMRDVKEMGQHMGYRSQEWNWPKEAMNIPI